MPPQETFHVFIDRTASDSPEVISKVAAGIAARFGVPVAMIEERLRAGRFRVKGNVDREKAVRFKSELERLGAVCSVVAADSPDVPARTPVTRLPTPPPMPVGQAVPRSALAGASEPVRSPAADGGPTGLAAAAMGAGDSGSLGALDDGVALASGSLRLSTLDGEDDVPSVHDPSERDLGPDADEGVLTLAPEPEREPEPPPPPPARSGWVGAHDPFLPPEMAQETEQILELDTPVPSRAPPLPSPAARAAAGATGAPEATGDRAPAAPAKAPAASQPAPSSTMAPEAQPLSDVIPRGKVNPLDRARSAIADSARVRLAAGVLAAIIVGFIPATIVSSLRERSAFAEIRKELEQQYAAATTPAAAEGLDAVRQAHLNLMSSKRTNIAVTACLMWAIVGAGFALFWFRRFDWTRYASSPPSSSSPRAPPPRAPPSSSSPSRPTSGGGGTTSR